MSQDLGLTAVGSAESRNILASGHPTMEVSVTIKTQSSTTMLRGTCLGKQTADGKYYEWDTNAVDGTQTLAGILVNETDISATDESADVYIEGHFLLESLIATVAIVAGSYLSGNILISKEKK